MGRSAIPTGVAASPADLPVPVRWTVRLCCTKCGEVVALVEDGAVRGLHAPIRSGFCLHRPAGRWTIENARQLVADGWLHAVQQGALC